jgi:signal peptidase II
LQYYVLAAVVLALDQLTKWAVKTNMALYEAIPVIGDFFQIYSHRNRGAAFGILQNQRLFFVIVTIIVLAAAFLYLRRAIRRSDRLLAVALSLLIGGAAGNFVDRALFGEVVDFFKFRFQFDWFGTPVDYTYPIFNVADIAIVSSVALILLDSLLAWRREKKEMMRNDG